MPYGDYNQIPQGNNMDWSQFYHPPVPQQDPWDRPAMPWAHQYGVAGQWPPQTPGIAGLSMGPSPAGTGLGAGAGLPGGGANIMDMVKKLMGQFGLQNPAAAPAPFQPPPGSNAAEQYLMQMKDMMAKLGHSGLPQLDPAMAAELAQKKAAMQGEIERSYQQAAGGMTADMYGRGMENSSLRSQGAINIGNLRAQAVSDMLSGLFGQEMGMRKDIGNLQQQGMQGEIGALGQLAQMAEGKDQQAYQNALQAYQTNLSLGEHGQDRQMQMIQFIMSMLPQLQEMGGLGGLMGGQTTLQPQGQQQQGGNRWPQHFPRF